jgi:hypothetical protein
VFASYEAEVSNKRWVVCSREASSEAYRALSRLIISDARIAIAVPTCGSTIAGIELSLFPAPHGKSVSRVTLGADRKFLWWCLCPTSRHFSRALVARAAQPIDVLSCEGLVRLDFVVLISQMTFAWPVALDTAHVRDAVVFAREMLNFHVDVTLQAAG